MTTDLPLACTLSPAALPTRLDEIRAVSRAALRAKRRDGTCAVLCFAPAPGIHERLTRIVAAEATCCAFLTMTLADEPDGIVLTIEAPAAATFVLEGLLASFEAASA